MTDAERPVVEAAVFVAAPADRVWALVSDIHLVASLSREVQEVTWLGDGTEAAVGRRFRGRNRHPAVGEWTTTSYVVECEPPRRFGWDVGLRNRPTASWSFELIPTEGGTRLRQWARLGPGPSNLDLAIEARPDQADRIVAGRLAEWREGMEANLRAITRLAEGGRVAPT